jgi:hypothetical protein
MSWPLIAVVMVIYACIGAMETAKGNYAFGLMWFGYSISNIALMWMALKGGL